MRALLRIALAGLLFALATGAAHALGATSLRLDLAAPLLCWLALRAGWTEGLISAAALGVLEGAFSGAGPAGFSVFLAVATFLSARAVGRRMLGGGAIFAAAFSGAVALARGLAGWVLLALFTERQLRGDLPSALALRTVLTAAAAPPLFALLHRLDAPRRERDLLLRGP